MKRLALGITLAMQAGIAAALDKGVRSEPPRLLTEGVGTSAIGLVVVVLLILALAWAFKRFGGRLPMASRGPVQVLGGVSLGTRERAVLLSVDGVRLLVGVAPGQVRTLHVLGADPAVEVFDETLRHAQQESEA